MTSLPKTTRFYLCYSIKVNNISNLQETVNVSGLLLLHTFAYQSAVLRVTRVISAFTKTSYSVYKTITLKRYETRILNKTMLRRIAVDNLLCDTWFLRKHISTVKYDKWRKCSVIKLATPPMPNEHSKLFLVHTRAHGRNDVIISSIPNTNYKKKFEFHDQLKQICCCLVYFYIHLNIFILFILEIINEGYKTGISLNI